jgi:hypothetical protein
MMGINTAPFKEFIDLSKIRGPIHENSKGVLCPRNPLDFYDYLL